MALIIFRTAPLFLSLSPRLSLWCLNLPASSPKAAFLYRPSRSGLGVVLPPGIRAGDVDRSVLLLVHGTQTQTRPKDSDAYQTWVEGAQSIAAAGLLAGSALIGIGNAFINVMM